MDFRKDHIIQRNGTSRADRFPVALRKDFIGIDERSFLELVRQAAEYAEHLVYYDDSNVPSGNWKEMFSLIYDYDKRSVRENVLDQLMASSQVPPHLALLLSFLKMFRIEQDQLNGLVDKSLSFYYKDALGFSLKQGSCGSVPLSGTLSKNVPEVFIPAGTKFVAGKDAEGREIHYQNNYDVTLNNASVKETKSYQDYKDFRCAFTFGSPLLEKKTGDSYVFPYLMNQDKKSRNKSFMDDLPSSEGLRVEYTSAGGWEQASIVKTADQNRDEVKKMAKDYTNCLHMEKEIAAYNPEVHGKGYSGNMPLIRFVSDYFNDKQGIQCDLFSQLYSLELKIVVLDTEDFVLENPEGVMQNRKGECIFGSMAREGSEFTIKFPHPYVGEPSLENVPGNRDEVSKRMEDTSGIIRYELITSKYDQRTLSNNYALGLKTLTEYKDITTSDINFTDEYSIARESSIHELVPDSIKISVSLTEVMTVNLNGIRNDIKKVEDSLKGKTILTVEESDEISETVNGILCQLKSVEEDLNNYKDSLAQDKNEIESEVRRLKTFLEDFAKCKIQRINEKQEELKKTLDSVKDVLSIIQGVMTDGEGLIAIVPELKEPVKVKCVKYAGTATDKYYTNPFLTYRIDDLSDFKRFNVSETSLYLGMTGLEKGENILNLYFRMNYRSAVPEESHLNWDYFDGKSWQPGRPFLKDSTLELRRNGVMSLAVEVDEDYPGGNCAMPDGCFWLRLNANEISLNAIEEIQCQSFEVEPSPDSPGKAPVGSALPAGSIKKSLSSIPGLKKISQQFDGNEGEFDETEEQFFCRVSERLRHKDRAWNSWDYEHIVLEHFPKVSSVKCVPLHGEDGKFAPGQVSVMVVPTSDVNQDNPLCPVVGGLSSEIKACLKERTSGQVEIHVVNPDYVPAKVTCEVMLRKGYNDKNIYKNEINEALKGFLSPWMKQGIIPVNVYDKNETDVLFFLENLPCVDYVKSLKVEAPEGRVVEEGEKLAPEGVFKVVASADEHVVTIADE